MRVKICGATSPADIDLLAGLGVDLAGIWHGTGGRSEVDISTLTGLCMYAGSRIEPVLVTLLSHPEALDSAIQACGVRWVQLHGYQPPGLVRRLKERGLNVIKALHLREDECVERALIGSYERAGVNLFLLDALGENGRVGSTGRRLNPAAVSGLARVMRRPFLLAGGVSAERPDGFAGWQSLSGVDIDSAARDSSGAFCANRIAAITTAWKGVRREPLHPSAARQRHTDHRGAQTPRR